MKKTILLKGAIRDIEEFHLIVDCIEARGHIEVRGQV